MRTKLVAALVVAYVAAQLALPTIGLFEPRPARWGWQMYSVAQAAPEAWGFDANGQRQPINLVGRLAVLRADTRDPAGIGRVLCAGTSFTAVEVRFGEAESGMVPCS